MKHGFRKPSIKKSIAARTVGNAKRNLKRALTPSYGRKGMGIFHPSRSAYNKIYRQTTLGINDLNTSNYNEKNNMNVSNNIKTITSDLIGVYSIIAILICIGIGGIVWFLNECFGPCEHEWKYVSYKHDYQCEKCRELKSQNQCIHNWEIIENSSNWYQRKCTECGKYETEKRF